jgi:uncharacterized protein YukJ
MVNQTTDSNNEAVKSPQGFVHYGVLKCLALEGKPERTKDDPKSPHYTIIAKDTQDQKYKIVINVKSKEEPSALMVFIDEDFKHPITNQLPSLQSGLKEIKKSERKAGGIALDFIRGNLFDITKMKLIPFDVEGDNNDLNDKIDFIVQQAIKKNTEVDLYAFGEPFDNNPGIHQIHMNQGNPKSLPFFKENGVFQDGALFFHFRTQNKWIAFFSAFQSQSFHTNDLDGSPIEQDDTTTGVKPLATGAEPLADVKSAVKIIAALVNPIGNDKGNEWVMLLNVTSTPVDVNNWSLKDRVKRGLPLNGIIQPGSIMTVTFPSQSEQDFQLGNNGGIITLLNAQGLKVDGISYTKEDVREQGYVVVF